MSNVKTLTATSISFILAAFLDRVESTWNGKSCFVFGLIATISLSIIKFLIGKCFMLYYIPAHISGYAYVIFSKFLEKMETLPFE